MPNHRSAWKRMRQNVKRRAVNRGDRSFLRKTIKAYAGIEDADAARDQFPGLASVIDKAAKKGIIHHRKAARLKSRLSKRTDRA